MEGVSAGRGSGRRTLNWLEVHEAFGFERRDSVEICAPLPVSMAAFYASNFKLFATCWQILEGSLFAVSKLIYCK